MNLVKVLSCEHCSVKLPDIFVVECIDVASVLIVYVYSLTLCEPVGEGNFGIVYRAQLRQNDQHLTVAVKMLKGSHFCRVFHCPNSYFTLARVLAASTRPQVAASTRLHSRRLYCSH